MKKMAALKSSGIWVLICCLGNINAQIIRDNFEGNGNISNWYGDDCGLNTSAVNPNKNGLNTSATALEYDDKGGQYANVRFEVSKPFNLAEGAVFKLKIYVPSSGITGSQTNQISLKLQNGNLQEPWSTQCEIIKPITLNAWQELIFDFEQDDYKNLNAGSGSPLIRGDFTRVVLQINGEGNTDRVKAYFDDVFYESKPIVSEVFDKLVWSDEFDKDGELDKDKWFKQTKLPAGNNWFNGEVQHYTNKLDNAYAEAGVLKLVAKKEAYTSEGVTKDFTSARLNSKFAFKYGKVEARMKLPSGVVTWPALWMLGKNITENGAYWFNEGFGTTSWPACGEIDIMEHWGTNENFVQSAMHTPSSSGGTINLGGRVVNTATTDFHVYVLEWTEDKMVFKVDDIVHYTYAPMVKDAATWPFDKEQYILLNIAILPNIYSNFRSCELDVDYIRVYQKSALGVGNEMKTGSKIYPNPANIELNIELPATINGKVKCEIFNLSGEIIRNWEETVANGKLPMIDISGIKKGIYQVRIKTDVDVYNGRFLK